MANGVELDSRRATIDRSDTDRIGGQDRYETSIKTAEALENVDEIAISDGESFAGALSLASVSGKNNIPVILVSKESFKPIIPHPLLQHNIWR